MLQFVSGLVGEVRTCAGDGRVSKLTFASREFTLAQTARQLRCGSPFERAMLSEFGFGCFSLFLGLWARLGRMRAMEG